MGHGGTHWAGPYQRAVQAQERLNRERARLKKRGREKLWTQSQQYYTGQTKMHVIEEHKTQLSQAQMKLREKKMRLRGECERDSREDERDIHARM